MQIGYFGLVTAAQKYSPKEGATFASYAVLRIRGAIVDHLRKSSNLCRTTIQMQQKQKKAIESLISSLQREPSPSEISEKKGLGLNEYRDWEKAFNAKYISLLMKFMMNIQCGLFPKKAHRKKTWIGHN